VGQENLSVVFWGFLKLSLPSSLLKNKCSLKKNKNYLDQKLLKNKTTTTIKNNNAKKGDPGLIQSTGFSTFRIERSFILLFLNPVGMHSIVDEE